MTYLFYLSLVHGIGLDNEVLIGRTFRQWAPLRIPGRRRTCRLERLGEETTGGLPDPCTTLLLNSWSSLLRREGGAECGEVAGPCSAGWGSGPPGIQADQVDRGSRDDVR